MGENNLDVTSEYLWLELIDALLDAIFPLDTSTLFSSVSIVDPNSSFLFTCSMSGFLGFPLSKVPFLEYASIGSVNQFSCAPMTESDEVESFLLNVSVKGVVRVNAAFIGA